LKAKASVKVHDPAALANGRRMFGERIAYFDRAYDALHGCDALVIVTEWLEFRNPDFDRIKQLLKQPIIVDGRNLYDPDKLEGMGFRYSYIGRKR
jgi:UDPglucose 6-dehydrogenase